jgi:hypothetical protein
MLNLFPLHGVPDGLLFEPEIMTATEEAHFSRSDQSPSFWSIPDAWG